MKIIKKYLDGGEMEERWLDGITVKPAGNRPTTREDWNWANWRELLNKRELQAAESVRRGIDRNGTPIAAGIYALAAAPFAIEGLGSSAVTNGVRTGLQAMNTFFTPSTWLNPVTGARLLSPTVSTVADAGVQGAFAYEGLNGLWNQSKQGTLLSDPSSTFIHGLEVLPLLGLGTKAIGMGVDAWNRSGIKALWDISRSNAPFDLSEYTRLNPKVRIRIGNTEVNNPQLTYRQGSMPSTADVSTTYFKSKDVDAANLLRLHMALRKISGLSPFSFSNEILPLYTRGLDLNTKRNLMHNTVERNIRELRKAGLSEELLEAERLAAREALDNVPIGHFTPEDYAAAEYESSGGFITNDGFISILDNPSFSVQFRKSIPRHEGRHLLQRHLTKPASYYKELPEAYGDDFERLNQWEGSPESIRKVKDMQAEREPTNRDSRDYLFSFNGKDKSLLEAELELLDRIIDYTPDDKIFEAVENSNGYGRAYIRYLREHNLLTPEKAQAFREAMKHVGSYIPIGFGLRYKYLNLSRKNENN